MRKILLIIILVLITSGDIMSQNDTTYQEADSRYFREQDLKRISTNYFNLSKPDKFNFEVIVIGGVKNSGIYLIPQGTSLVEVVALTGGAPDESIYEDFKLIRTKNKNPELKKDTVIIMNYNDFFEKNESGQNISIKTILLKPGDIVAFPIKPEKDFWEIAQRIAGVVVVPILSLLTLYIQVLLYNR